MGIAYSAYLFIIGMCLGSFANACIYRWLNNESLLPRSRCPVCGHGIAWYDNIPVISYLLLRGKCRHCHTPIPLRYPIVEILMGFFVWATYHIYGLQYKIIFLCFIFLVAFVCDLMQREIPDELLAIGVIVGTASAILGETTWTSLIVGIFVPAIPLLILTMVMEYVLGKEDLLGGGDMKFLMGVGALGGSYLSCATLFLGDFAMLLFFCGVMIEGYFSDARTEVPMAVGFFLAFLMMFLTGTLTTIIDL